MIRRFKALRALGVRNFRLFFFAQMLSQAGTWVQIVAQTLLVLRLTGSGLALALVALAQFGPTMILGAWAGVVVDRTDKRVLMYVTQSIMMVTAVAIGLLVHFDAATVGVVYAAAAVMGIANAFDNPARRSIAAELVPQPLIISAVGLNSVVMTSAQIAGPAIATIVLATAGIAWCFLLNGVSFLPVIIAMAAIRFGEAPPAPPEPRRRGQFTEGLRYIWSTPELRFPLLLLASLASLTFNWQVLLPLFADRELAGGDSAYTTLAALMGVGSLAGSISVARLSSVDTRLLSKVACGLALATLGVAASPNLVVSGAVVVFWGLASSMLIAGTQSALQVQAAQAMRGRVMALYGVVFLGCLPIAGFIGGLVAEALSTRYALAVNAVAALACGVVGWLLARRRGRDDGVVPVGGTDLSTPLAACMTLAPAVATDTSIPGDELPCQQSPSTA